MGFNFPFLLKFHSFANLGLTVFRSLYPFTIFLLAQVGQPFPRFLSFIDAIHSCPSEHFHHTLLLLPALTSRGVKSPFLFLAHSIASSGLIVSKSFIPYIITLLSQIGQPFPLCLAAISACHS